MTVYDLRDVSRSFGEFRALQGVTLAIRPGERVAVLGPSGAGKSTLLRLMNTASSASTGRVEVLGVVPPELDPEGLRKLRARIGTIHQRLDLVPQASVFHNVVAGRLGRRSLVSSVMSLWSRREAEEVSSLLERLGIADKLYVRVDRLSGGEQQRVAIARVLYQAPDVVIADEPLASVDPARSTEIMALLAEAAADRTLIVSTHQWAPVVGHVTRVIGLRGGALQFDLPAQALTTEQIEALYRLERSASPERPRPVGGGPPS